MIYGNGFSEMEVRNAGKGYKTITSYPATKHNPAEKVEKNHRTWSAVEKIIKKRGYSVVA